MKRLLLRCFFILLLSGSSTLYAQLEEFENIESIKKKGFFKTYFKDLFKGFTDFGDPFTMSGGAGLNMRSYSAFGQDPRQDPFFWSFNANLNMRIYRLNLPVSFLVAAKNKESSFPSFKEIIQSFKDNARNYIEQKKQSFVRFGASPNYKWIKLHLGHRSMNFSKFTLSNLNFFGAGAELTPGKWRIGTMYGRLAKAEPIDISLVTPNLPVYQRMGWGTRIGYGNDNHSADLILFKGYDDPSSIFIPNDNSEQLSPEENMVVGFNGSTLLFKKFRLKVETAISGYSPNVLEDASGEGGMVPGFLFRRRTTSEEYLALDTRLDYEAKQFTIGAEIKRIDPNYNSFGAYFFNNDVIDVLGNLNFVLLNNQINVTLSSGVQGNNLKFSNPTTTTRFVFTGDVAYSKDAFSVGGNYSNNTTDVAYVLNQSLDSLNAVIVTDDTGGNISYSLPDKAGNQHVFSLTGNIQQVRDDVLNPLESAASRMLVGNFVYNYALTESKWKFSAKANFNQNELASSLTQRYGGGFGIQKSLLKNKMNFGIDANYFLNTIAGSDSNSNLNGNLIWSYKIFAGLTSNFSLGLLQTTGSTQASFSELTGTFGAQYSFSYKPDKKKIKGILKTGKLMSEKSEEVEPKSENKE